MDSTILLKKFKGCLLGALIGDCLGAPFEYVESLSSEELNDFFDELYGPYMKNRRKYYTDDTVMTKVTVASLIEKKGLDCKDLAMKWVHEYFNDPLLEKRYYGEQVPNVFYALRRENFRDLYGPASAQFGGSGSYGNGGAMRVAPLALFFHNDYDAMIDAVTKATRITHTHKLGINGALLQAIAIYESLQLNPEKALNVHMFCSRLIERMIVIEGVNGIPSDEEESYVKQLCQMEQLLNSHDITHDSVIKTLGNLVTAFESVTTAIFCFLLALKPIRNIKTDNPTRRAMQYAVSLGGDTDTIASMSGAIAGAYYGDAYFTSSILKHCDSSEETIKAAAKLFACIS